MLRDLVGRLLAPRGDATPPLRPLLVAHPGGRTGTTLLMQLLGTSPRILFERSYPFETRYLTYLLRWASLLEPDGDASWPAANVTRLDAATLGPMPWTETTLWDGATLAPTCFAAAWREFSRSAVARSHPPGRPHDAPAPLRWAEKVPPWVPARLRRVMPCDVIVLVRDPRDVFLSIGAFDAKRGFPGFSRRPDDDDWTFARRWVALCRERYATMREEAARTESLLVRYEDLATDLEAAARRITAWLGTPLDARRVEAGATAFAYHMTSPSPDASVGRWRSELAPDLAAFFAAELPDELAHFGWR